MSVLMNTVNVCKVCVSVLMSTVNMCKLGDCVDRVCLIKGYMCVCTYEHCERV